MADTPLTFALHLVEGDEFTFKPDGPVYHVRRRYAEGCEYSYRTSRVDGWLDDSDQVYKVATEKD